MSSPTSDSRSVRPLRVLSTALMAVMLIVGFMAVSSPSEASSDTYDRQARIERGLRSVVTRGTRQAANLTWALEKPDTNTNFFAPALSASIEDFFDRISGGLADDFEPEAGAVECAAPFVLVDGHCELPDHDCNEGEYLSSEGDCVEIPGEPCDDGFIIGEGGECLCSAPFEVDDDDECELPEEHCDAGQVRWDQDCVDIEDPCFAPAEKSDSGECICPTPYVSDDNGQCEYEVPECEDGMVLGKDMTCVEPPAPNCFPPFVVEDNHCVLPDLECDADEFINHDGECEEIAEQECDDNWVAISPDECICPAPFSLDDDGKCEVHEIECEAPAKITEAGKCVEIDDEELNCYPPMVENGDDCFCPMPFELTEAGNCEMPEIECPAPAILGAHGECIAPEAECFPPFVMTEAGECELAKPECLQEALVAEDHEAADICLGEAFGRRFSS